MFWWISLAIAVSGLSYGEWRLMGSLHSDVVRMNGDQQQKGPPYAIKLSGAALAGRVATELTAVNAERLARLHGMSGDAVAVEDVHYERNAGTVHANGRIRDLGDSRSVLAVMDAYDDDRNYLVSVSSSVSTVKGVPVEFALTMPDRVDLATLSFRVLRQDKSEIMSLTSKDLDQRQAALDGRAVLLMDDAVEPADLPEAVERLRHIDYLPESAASVGEPGLLVVFNRFRKDHGLPPTKLVDIGTFLAIRVVTSDFTPSDSATL